MDFGGKFTFFVEIFWRFVENYIETAEKDVIISENVDFHILLC